MASCAQVGQVMNGLYFVPHQIYKEKSMMENFKLQENDVDAFKLVFDLLKHLTTLSSGSILLILTLAEKFFANSPFKGVLFLALAAFCLSILAALSSMTIISFNIGGGVFSAKSLNSFTSAVALSAFGFICGMIFIVFAVARQYT
jgi:hypothetical protein